MQKGAKTSEFYIVLAIIVPYISQQFGIDFSALGNPDDIAGAIKAAHDQNAPAWVAGAYVVGRFLLKWRAAK